MAGTVVTNRSSMMRGLVSPEVCSRNVANSSELTAAANRFRPEINAGRTSAYVNACRRPPDLARRCSSQALLTHYVVDSSQ